MLSKIKTIILSRFKKNKEENWVNKRRETCSGCEYNSINSGTKSKYKFFLATLSYFFSLITFRAKEDNLGNCTACSSCSIYFKTLEKEETCEHPRGSKWKNI